MASQSLVIKRLITSYDTFSELKSKVEGLKYDSNSGEGFHVIENEENFFSAYYIYDVMNSVNVYEAETNGFKKIQMKQQEHVYFFLDYQCQSIDIFGTRIKCSKIINTLGKLAEYKIAVDDVLLEPTKIFSALATENINYKVNRIKIRDYEFFDNILGDCTLNLENYYNVDLILDKYKEKITQFSICIDFEQPTLFMFYKSGAITIYKESKDIDVEKVRLLKKCIV